MAECSNRPDADLVVVNTCTVTHRSDQQVRQAIRRLHRENPNARIVVTGCYAERDPETLAAIPGVSVVVGNVDKEHLPEILELHEPDAQGKIIRTPLDADRDYLLPTMAKPAPLSNCRTGVMLAAHTALFPRYEDPDAALGRRVCLKKFDPWSTPDFRR
jgi:tRNA A37 methylthiotransferase MiaB